MFGRGELSRHVESRLSVPIPDTAAAGRWAPAGETGAPGRWRPRIDNRGR